MAKHEDRFSCFFHSLIKFISDIRGMHGVIHNFHVRIFESLATRWIFPASYFLLSSLVLLLSACAYPNGMSPIRINLSSGSSIRGDFYSLPFTASASSSASGYSISNINSGSANIFWLASLSASPANNSASVTLDLGQPKMVSTLSWTSPYQTIFPASGPANYSIEISMDGQTWKAVVARTNPVAIYNGSEVISRTTRYLRFATTQVNDGTGWALAFSKLTVTGLSKPDYRVCGIIDPRGMTHEQGYNYIVSDFAWGGDTHDSGGAALSNVMTFENGQAMGPAHSFHQDIRNLGQGHFSHWYTSLHFSTTDNSNPITNGRTYTYGVPQGQQCPLLSFTPLELSGRVPGYATFQSHTPHVVSNRYGIFLTFANAEATGELEQWTLLRSTDGGATFVPLYTSPMAHTRAPTIETDEDGNLYIFSFDFGPSESSGTMTLLTFSAASNFTAPTTLATLPNAIGGAKATAIYDPDRKVFYFASMGDVPNQFAILGKNGQIIEVSQLFAGGNSLEEYPHLAIDGTRLYFAWTTTPNSATIAAAIGYDGIHFVYSDDGGHSWVSSDGKALKVPFAADDTGPVPDLVPTAYRGVYNSWLANFAVSNGIGHFFYDVAGEARSEIYQRVSINADAITTSTDWGISGERITAALDGFFTRDLGNPSTLYAIGYDGAEQNAQGMMPIIVLKSTDNGLTWAEYAKSSKLYHPYALGGARYISGHGITGAFTNYIDSSGALNAQQVYYFGLTAN